MIFDPTELMRPNIKALTPYSTARDEFSGEGITAWLDANESPFDNGVNRYPDPHQKELKKVVSELFGAPVDTIFIGGAGSDEAIDLLMRIFCIPGKDNIVTIAPTYGVYEVSAAINDIEVRQVPLGEGYSLQTDALVEAADDNTKLTWVCSPNNPTGNAFSIEELCSLAEKTKGMLVIDEAYVDFSTKGSMLPLLERYPNVIVLRTLSKARGMASLRLGMAFAHPSVARAMAMAKYPYNVNGPTQWEVIRRLQATPDIAPDVATLIAERRRLEEKLPQVAGVKKVYPSDANFLLVKFDDPDAVYEMLLRGGALVRNRNRVPGCEGCLRITVGTPEQNELLLKLLEQ
ncbi:MAG: histidinol-phosphate transaminase [Barnesiella sp.]|nr:histidinol-phosphate transaminase [Barnesiella sp.]